MLVLAKHHAESDSLPKPFWVGQPCSHFKPHIDGIADGIAKRIADCDAVPVFVAGQLAVAISVGNPQRHCNCVFDAQPVRDQRSHPHRHAVPAGHGNADAQPQRYDDHQLHRDAVSIAKQLTDAVAFWKPQRHLCTGLPHSDSYGEPGTQSHALAAGHRDIYA